MSLFRRWVLAFVAPKPLVGALHLPRYLRDWLAFRAAAPAASRPRLRDSYPCLTDWSPSTPFDPHYFYQGAWLARHLAARHAPVHVDVGSSVMMLSVMTAWAPTVFVDVRPLHANISGLLPVAGSIGRLPFADGSVASLSSLHVIEHIGLGRYGDPLDPEGATRAAAELRRVLAPGGRLYLSTPVGRERVCFNAHRVFAADTVCGWFNGLRLAEFACVDDRGNFKAHAALEDARNLDYGCGMFAFARD